MNNQEPQVYIFMGRSGCGKGTQVEFFMKDLSEKDTKKNLYIETGSFFREFIQSDSYTATFSKQVVESGGLPPAAMAVYLWMTYLVNNFTGKENIISDGAPRKLLEAELLDGVFKFYGIKNYKVIYINVSREWAKEKLFGRGRKDDTEEGVESRLAWFDKDVMPAVEFFKNNKDCEFIDINGEQTREEVHAEILQKVF